MASVSKVYGWEKPKEPTDMFYGDFIELNRRKEEEKQMAIMKTALLLIGLSSDTVIHDCNAIVGKDMLYVTENGCFLLWKAKSSRWVIDTEPIDSFKKELLQRFHIMTTPTFDAPQQLNSESSSENDSD